MSHTTCSRAFRLSRIHHSHRTRPNHTSWFTTVALTINPHTLHHLFWTSHQQCIHTQLRPWQPLLSHRLLSTTHPSSATPTPTSAATDADTDIDTDRAAIDVEDAYRLGCAYYEGKDGHPRDYKLALVHFTTAATQQHAPSQARLGLLYLLGYGAARDLTNALTFLTRAAAQHNADALHTLASLHYRGVGVPRDHKQAAALWKRASEAGHGKAAVRYAVMNVKGEGKEERQLAEAVQWLERGVLDNEAEAQYVLGMLLAHRHPYRRNEMPAHTRGRKEAAFDDVPRDDKRSVQLLHAAATANNVPALTALGDHYAGHTPSADNNKTEHSPDYQQAISYYAQAADHADIHAQSRLAFLLLNQPTTTSSASPAASTSHSPLVLLSTAAEGGIVSAQLQLIASAWQRGQEGGGVLGKLKLKVAEVMKEYGAKVWDTIEREAGEWNDEERTRLGVLRERPEEVVAWLEAYERVRGGKWMGDVHDLLAVVEKEPVQQQQKQQEQNISEGKTTATQS